MKSARLVSIIIGALIALLGVGMVLRGGVFTRASDDTPKEVQVITDSNDANSVVIKWKTDIETQGQVLYSTDQNGPWDRANIAPEERATTDHAVKLTLLTPGTPYFYKIQIKDTVYDLNGFPYQFDTQNGLTNGTNGNSAVPVITRPPGVSPIQKLKVPAAGSTNTSPTTATSPVQSCNYTDCDQIKQNFGNGCSTQDYLRCMQK